MKPADFAAKYSQIQQKESVLPQSPSNDICTIICHKPPLTYDPTGKDFSFEKRAALDQETHQSVTRGKLRAFTQSIARWMHMVLQAYGNGRPKTLTDVEILVRLLALNLERAGESGRFTGSMR